MATTASQPPLPDTSDDLPIPTAPAEDTMASDATAAPGPMHAAMDHASESAASLRETLGHCVDEACLMGRECTESARSTVRASPLAAITTALALGFVAGRLCR